MMTQDFGQTGHPSAEQIAAYLEDALSRGEKNQVLQHLSECDQCRREVVEVRRVLRRGPPLRGWMGLGLAAAAVILLAFPLTRGAFNRPDSLRSPIDPRLEGTATIAVIAPSEGVLDSPTDILFLWHSVEGGLRYEVTLSDEVGDVVWSTSTTDTTVTLGSDVQLEPEGRFFWFVDVLTARGDAVSSGVREFTIR
jgi:hypothetical protein